MDCVTNILFINRKEKRDNIMANTKEKTNFKIIHFCSHKQIDLLEKTFQPFVTVFNWPLAGGEWFEEKKAFPAPKWIAEMRKRVHVK